MTHLALRLSRFRLLWQKATGAVLAARVPVPLIGAFALLLCSFQIDHHVFARQNSKDTQSFKDTSSSLFPAIDAIDKNFQRLDQQYREHVLPLIQKSCCQCHNDDALEGELSLSAFTNMDRIRSQAMLWQNILAQIQSGEMPPADSSNLSASEITRIERWTKEYLSAESFANAGDPGAVVLRRLSNDEYTYSLRDLTGLEELRPAEQFPVDGAAGEGFTNVGSGLVMSPGLLSKYVNAAKGVAEHLVLLPDGIGFSTHISRRDRTDELLRKIREFYTQHTVLGGDTSRNLQGVKFRSQDAGIVELKPYILATINYRKTLFSDKSSISSIALKEGINTKYLARIWSALTSENASILLDPLRAQWKTAEANDADTIVAEIEAWQNSLWQFTTVGHIGKRDGPKAWQEPISPLKTSHRISYTVQANGDGSAHDFYLTTFAAGDGESGDVARWINPRLVIPGYPDVNLQVASEIAAAATDLRTSEISRTKDYLAAVAEMRHKRRSSSEVATQMGLDSDILNNWAELAKRASPTTPTPVGHFTNRLENVGGYADIQGWGEAATPSMIANRSETTYQFSTLTVPGRSVVVHPSPDQPAIVYWQCPMHGEISISGLVADADGNCGNGIHWELAHLSTSVPLGMRLDDGNLENAASIEFAVQERITVKAGDLIRLSIDPRDRDHVCDSTQINLHLELTQQQQRTSDAPLTWDLCQDVATNVVKPNPFADQYGHENVWHFCANPKSPVTDKLAFLKTGLLAEWTDSLEKSQHDDALRIAEQIQQLILDPSATDDTDNHSLRDEILNWRGSLGWLDISIRRGKPDDAISDIFTTPGNKRFLIPEHFIGATFLATVLLEDPESMSGSIQVTVGTSPIEDTAGVASPSVIRDFKPGKWTDPNYTIDWEMPILVAEGSIKQRSLDEQIQQFRDLFPAAMCYVKIVPVDEVVTLTLFHREDHHLKQLMLDDVQAEQLDQLWRELHFVSQDALKLVDAFEQLWQFATQDADPSAFEPMRLPIMRRAEAFRKTLREAESNHIQGLTLFARLAWRHSQVDEIDGKVQAFYQRLRDDGMEHDEAVKLTLARILVAPEFLYKLEQPQSAQLTLPVRNNELATRLSYFLWSSIPDEELVQEVTLTTFANEQQRITALKNQAARMLADAKVRRLAEQFGCQWIGVRNFALHDEKSESLFPEFATLRNSMAQEAVMFFSDFFQNDRSILSLLDADHSFVDETLENFYSVKAMPAKEPAHARQASWRQVSGMQALGRGGVMGMAATLAKHSGASRTSPILRGNWVYETLLGQHLPKPPSSVPVLPESVPAGLTERQLIEMHSRAPECAKCHQKIDGFGFALESFDAIGRYREGANTTTVLPDDTQINGLAGMRDYLIDQRRDEFVMQFCRKLLGYSLGRSIQLSDQPLLAEMAKDLEKNGYRVSVAVQRIVTSRQFTHIRGLSSER